MTQQEEMSDPLIEDEVVTAVREYLKKEGYRIVSNASATERGEDLVAESTTEDVHDYIQVQG